MKNDLREGKSLGPKWRAPKTAAAGDQLVYYSAAATFTLVVLCLQHGGAWVFGRHVDDRIDSKLGPVAVPLASCMTPAQAKTVLKGVSHPDSICDIADTHVTS
jgi:hypothetical protein